MSKTPEEKVEETLDSITTLYPNLAFRDRVQLLVEEGKCTQEQADELVQFYSEFLATYGGGGGKK